MNFSINVIHDSCYVSVVCIMEGIVSDVQCCIIDIQEQFESISNIGEVVYVKWEKVEVQVLNLGVQSHSIVLCLSNSSWLILEQ